MAIKIFYSWQSDIDFNKRAIRDALRLAIKEIEKDEKNERINLMDSSSNLVGSTRIPESILKDISTCDIFVCDLTIIGKSDNNKRNIPNPNVLLELGYAVAVLGWERTIVIFNEQFGVLNNDLPFDIEKRSTLTCRIEDNNDSNGRGVLKLKLRDWIKRIIDQNPARNNIARLNGDVTKRKRDIATLKNFLTFFDINQIDSFFQNGQISIETSFIDNWKRFIEFVDSKSFFLYDQNAKELLIELRNNDVVMNKLLLAYKEGEIVYSRADLIMHSQQFIAQSVSDIKKIEGAFLKVLDYIRHSYLEIKTNKTDKRIEIKSQKVFKSRNQSDKIFIEEFKSDNNKWVFPFWGINQKFPSSFTRGDGYVSISGTINAWARTRGTNGAYIDLHEGIVEDEVYEITCRVKSSSAATTMRFQLWVHDTIEGHNITNPKDSNSFSSFGENYVSISVQFRATQTKAMRIHLHCTAGVGAIIIKDVIVRKIKSK